MLIKQMNFFPCTAKSSPKDNYVSAGRALYFLDFYRIDTGPTITLAGRKTTLFEKVDFYYIH